MSPIGRVFIVLNLALSAAFLGFSGFYLHHADSYKKLLEREKTARAEEKQKFEERIATLMSDLDSAKSELQTTNARLNEKISALKAADEENKDLKSRLNKVQASLASVEASLSTMSDTIEKQNQRTQELEKLYLAAKQEKEQALSERADMEDRLAVAEADLNKAKTRIEALMGEIAEKDAAIRDYKVRFDVAVTKFPALDEILRGAVPPIDATVANVDPALKLVTITTGSKAEVKKGYTFAIHDGKTYKGEIEIIDVMEGAAVGRIRQLVQGASIRRGDRATTRLR